MIIGASWHGKVIADIALRCGYDEVVFLDDNPAVKKMNIYY
ncbi:PglD-related sugar-binding protein [Pseudobutyrivibrio sp. 49]